jgi:hypothetical protein
MVRVLAFVAGVVILILTWGTSCTIPSSMDYKCEGGRKVEIEHQYEVALFGFDFIKSKQTGQVVGECHEERELGTTK